MISKIIGVALSIAFSYANSDLNGEIQLDATNEKHIDQNHNMRHIHDHDNKHLGGHSHSHISGMDLSNSNIINFAERYVFRYQTRYNALLATFLLQVFPFLIYVLVPAFRNMKEDGLLLQILSSFAVGTLFGDLFLHLIPESFHEISDASKLSSTMTAMFIGFLMFCILDKSIRILTFDTENQEEQNIHSHSHSHSQLQKPEEDEEFSSEISHKSTSFQTSEVNEFTEIKKRYKNKKEDNFEKRDVIKNKIPTKKNVIVYLNVISGVIHNVTDGIALASAFYNSNHIGVITTIAILFHEFPHELGDFAILMSNGMTFVQAMKSQIFTSVGAMAGTTIGCMINELTKSVVFNKTSNNELINSTIPDLMLPITTGGFIYIATVGAIPNLLRLSSKTKTQEAKRFSIQVFFVLFGFYLMSQFSA